jgi:hypothetical protein
MWSEIPSHNGMILGREGFILGSEGIRMSKDDILTFVESVHIVVQHLQQWNGSGVILTDILMKFMLLPNQELEQSDVVR